MTRRKDFFKTLHPISPYVIEMPNGVEAPYMRVALICVQTFKFIMFCLFQILNAI